MGKYILVYNHTKEIYSVLTVNEYTLSKDDLEVITHSDNYDYLVMKIEELENSL